MKKRDLLFADFKNAELTSTDSKQIFGGFGTLITRTSPDCQLSDVSNSCTDGDIGCCDNGTAPDQCD